MDSEQWGGWCVSGEYGNGFWLSCPLCDWEYQSPVVSAVLYELKALADAHAAEVHPSG